MRIDEVEGPLEIGKSYEVPVLRAKYGGRRDYWPVLLPIHGDVEFFAVHKEHYHTDTRFFDDSQWAHMKGETDVEKNENANNAVIPYDDLYKFEVEWRTLECRRLIPNRLAIAAAKMAKVDPRNEDPFRQCQTKYAGKQCKHAKGAWICPHQGARLNGVPVVDGIVTCPLHGLRINHETGIVLPAVDLSGEPNTVSDFIHGRTVTPEATRK